MERIIVFLNSFDKRKFCFKLVKVVVFKISLYCERVLNAKYNFVACLSQGRI